MNEALDNATQLLKVMAEKTRLSILYHLIDNEISVSGLCELLSQEQSVVSHHLFKLRSGRLVKTRRDGKNVLYSLSDDHVKTLVQQALEHAQEI